MELATAYQKLGADVTVIEQREDAMPAYGASVTEVVRERAKDLGVEFAFGLTAIDWEPAGKGLTLLAETDDRTVAEFGAETCLVAVGREPVTDTVNLAAADIETDGRGIIITDNKARTSADHIFAVGDAAGDPMLAHAAFAEGEVAAEVIAGEPAALDHRGVPAAVFTDPEVGTVGLTEFEAREAGFDPVVGEMPLRASGRAMTLGDTDGFVRVVADNDGGFVLGGEVVGPEASELIATLGIAVELGATLEDVAKTIHVHPTLSEAVHEAVKNARDQSVHC
ncbi:MAG: pyruvate/2-oxoglutarate dehydrogenase complex, dihydrolipoamide dehydrogenase-like component [halophilic archaeon J07HX5]|jgi:dihydrolipoamide dehydrogenase (EC 1.8.1.4)|nr:MAG: pyruvate/2-oxoglutarate dehydrogenase complex, dihydrolipoamide dehydrogenase-like component [halophilic archaeon J07HX5]